MSMPLGHPDKPESGSGKMADWGNDAGKTGGLGNNFKSSTNLPETHKLQHSDYGSLCEDGKAVKG